MQINTNIAVIRQAQDSGVDIEICRYVSNPYADVGRTVVDLSYREAVTLLEVLDSALERPRVAFNSRRYVGRVEQGVSDG